MSALRPSLVRIVAVLGLGAGLWSAPGTAESPRALETDLHATRLPDRAVVAHEGTITSLRLPTEARLERLVAARGGWVLTATSEANGARPEILVWTAEPNGITQPMPSLAIGDGARARDPIPLVGREGALDGVAWLEGTDPQHLAVRFAEWNGAAWLPSAELSGPAPGSQLALDAATLADGTHVLVWSRYDGQDDEIFWTSIDREGVAAEPRRLQADNDVPDITPAVVATPAGPLTAWSRYDGRDYRLHLARLVGSEWRLIDTLPGRGAFLPQWQRSADGALYLTYREGGRQAWTTARMDADGSVRAIARVPAPADASPRIEVVDGKELLVLGEGPVPLDWHPTPRLP